MEIKELSEFGLPFSWVWGCCFLWSAFRWSSTTGPAHQVVTKAAETSLGNIRNYTSERSSRWSLFPFWQFVSKLLSSESASVGEDLCHFGNELRSKGPAKRLSQMPKIPLMQTAFSPTSVLLKGEGSSFLNYKPSCLYSWPPAFCTENNVCLTKGELG